MNGDILPEMMPGEQGDLLLMAEKSILEQEMAKQIKSDAETLWNGARNRVLDIVHDKLGQKKIILGNKAATVVERVSDKWIQEKVREVVEKSGLASKVFKKELKITFEDPETLVAIQTALEKIKKKDTSLEASLHEMFDEKVLEMLVATNQIAKDDLKDSYETKTSRWTLVKDVDRKDDAPKMIII